MGLMSLRGDQEGATQAAGHEYSDARGNWTMSCLACHGGQSRRKGHSRSSRPFTHGPSDTGGRCSHGEDQSRKAAVASGSWFVAKCRCSARPMGQRTRWSSESFWGRIENPDMSVDLQRKLPPLLHHDVDAPPFWNVRKKRSLYADGFAPKTARPLIAISSCCRELDHAGTPCRNGNLNLQTYARLDRIDRSPQVPV